MRVLHVIGSIAPRLGGPSRVVLELATALSEQGHEVDVVTSALADRGSWLPRGSVQGLEPVRTGLRQAQDGYHITYCRPSWPTRWVMSREMFSVLQERIRVADVVHIHSLYLFPTLLASRLARAHRVPYVIRPHGTLDPYIRRRHRVAKRLYSWLIESATLRHAAAVHFTTSEERDLARPALPEGINTCVIPLGVDVSEFATIPDRETARSALGLASGEFVWLFLGRLNHKKGLDLLASAFVQFAKEAPSSRLIVAGPDDDGLGKRLLDECALGGVANRVTLTGFLDRAQTKRALAAADSWILPSYSENFGVAVVEAMAAQLPVVITDRINIWRAVQQARAGVITRAETGSVLKGMLLVAQMPHADRVAMGARGRELCSASYSWTAIARELTALYEELADKCHRPFTNQLLT